MRYTCYCGRKIRWNGKHGSYRHIAKPMEEAKQEEAERIALLEVVDEEA